MDDTHKVICVVNDTRDRRHAKNIDHRVICVGDTQDRRHAKNTDHRVICVVNDTQDRRHAKHTDHRVICVSSTLQNTDLLYSLFVVFFYRSPRKYHRVISYYYSVKPYTNPPVITQRIQQIDD